MSDRDPLLPPGIKVGSAIGEDERSKVRMDLGASLPNRDVIAATVVFDTTRQARALGALLIKQADLIDEAERGRSMLRVIGGSDR